jgi:hypothetical protein
LPPDDHPKVPVAVGTYKRADIDTDLAQLISELWTMNCDTVGSCQNCGGGWAYVQFVTMNHGAQMFIDVLVQMNVPVIATESPGRLSIGTMEMGRIRFNTIIVKFPAKHIDLITQSLHAHNNPQDAPAVGS